MPRPPRPAHPPSHSRTSRLAAPLREQHALETLRLRPISRLAHSLLFKEFERGYDAVVGFMLVHEELLEEHEHGTPFSQDTKIDATFKEAVEANVDEARKALATLRLDWPQMCTAIHTFKAARMVLNAAKAKVNSIKHHGGLVDTESERFLDLLDQQGTKIAAQPPTEALPAEERANFIPATIRHTTARTSEALDAEAAELGGHGFRATRKSRFSRRPSSRPRVAPSSDKGVNS